MDLGMASAHFVMWSRTPTRFSSSVEELDSFGVASIKLFSGGWCHANFPGLFGELQACTAGSRHIRWLAIGVLMWMLCMIHNKLVIERSPLRCPVDAIL